MVINETQKTKSSSWNKGRNYVEFSPFSLQYFPFSGKLTCQIRRNKKFPFIDILNAGFRCFLNNDLEQ